MKYLIFSIAFALIGLFVGCNRDIGKHIDKVQLWEDGPYWATTNIGAEKPEDYGLYFWWGDTVGYKREDGAWVASDGSTRNFSFSEENTPTYDKDLPPLQIAGWTTSAGVLAPEHDAAHVQWGGAWRMPTKQELHALQRNCDWTWTTIEGVEGHVVRGRGAYSAASIFLPAAGGAQGTSLRSAGVKGYYWSSVMAAGTSELYSECLNVYSDFETDYSRLSIDSMLSRFLGMTIRPVQEFTDKAQPIMVSLDPQGGVGGRVSVTATYGSVLPSIKVPTRTGYTFDGYWTDANCGGTRYYDATGAGTWSDLTSTTTLYAKWTADSADRAKVQLWKCGPYWATTNVGAKNPEDYGLYFWWGDTVGYKYNGHAWVASDGSTPNFSFSKENTPTSKKANADLRSEGWITSEGVLAPEHDAAHVHWGGYWRMPTEQEMSDLNSKCDWTWTTMYGVNGYVIRGRGDYASNCIFLPCAGAGETSLNGDGRCGYYWSSVPASDYPGLSRMFIFISDFHDTRSGDRYGGQSVRPVQVFDK